MVPTRLVIALLLLPAALLAQEKVLTEAIDHFKGAADEARKANPLLAAGTGDGVVKVIKGLGSRRSYGKAPVNVELPKEQQEELARRQKARERAEQLAKAGPRRAAAPKPAESSLPAVTPLVLLAIQNPTPKPRFILIDEKALNHISPGQPRADVLAALGNPSSTAAVRGLEDGDRELLTYHLAPDRTVAIRLLAGVVTAITRP
jgi:hypothetical protein